MANLYWPSEKTFKYEFNDELNLEIPFENSINKELNENEGR